MQRAAQLKLCFYSRLWVRVTVLIRVLIRLETQEDMSGSICGSSTHCRRMQDAEPHDVHLNKPLTDIILNFTESFRLINTANPYLCKRVILLLKLPPDTSANITTDIHFWAAAAAADTTVTEWNHHKTKQVYGFNWKLQQQQQQLTSVVPTCSSHWNTSACSVCRLKPALSSAADGRI